MTGPQLIEWRKARGWSQSRLAEALGTTRWSIARYEAAEAVPRVVELALTAIKRSKPTSALEAP